MVYSHVRYDSGVVIYERKMFIRLATDHTSVGSVMIIVVLIQGHYQSLYLANPAQRDHLAHWVESFAPPPAFR